MPAWLSMILLLPYTAHLCLILLIFCCLLNVSLFTNQTPFQKSVWCHYHCHQVETGESSLSLHARIALSTNYCSDSSLMSVFCVAFPQIQYCSQVSTCCPMNEALMSNLTNLYTCGCSKLLQIRYVLTVCGIFQDTMELSSIHEDGERRRHSSETVLILVVTNIYVSPYAKINNLKHFQRLFHLAMFCLFPFLVSVTTASATFPEDLHP